MTWIADKYGALTWHEPISEASLDAAFAAFKAHLTQPAFKIGDKLTIRATVTGFKQRHVQVVLDNVPDDMLRSFSYPTASLALASTVAYVAPDTDAA